MKNRQLLIFLLVLCGFTAAIGQVRLNEVCSKNTNSFPVGTDSPDWIELYNEGSQAINLQGYMLSDDIDEPNKWTFPTISIPANGYLIILADGDDELDQFAHTNFKISDGGEDLVFSLPSGEVIEEVEVPSLVEDITFSWLGTEWKRSLPTPLASNNGGALPKLATPIFDQVTGTYDQNMQVNITASTGGERVEYYINDFKGLTKTEDVSVSINLQSSAIICARSDASDKEQSEFLCHTFIIGLDHDLPILSVLADEEDLFDPVKGLFELGPDADTEWPFLGANFWSDDSEEVYFQYIGKDRSEIYQAHADLEMHGGRQARTHPQKTFKLLAKAKYDLPYFEYPFFDDQPEIDSYKRIVVRNGSGDYNVAHCRDGFVQQHVKNASLDLDGVAYEPIAVYINGRYYGLMGLREKIDEYYTESHYETTDVDILEEELLVSEGDALTFIDHLSFLMDNDLSDAETFSIAASYFDTESLIDYVHTQIGNSNFDWPLNNIKYWRERKAGAKWRYFLFDLDASMGRFGWTEADDDVLKAKLDIPASTSVFVTVLEAFLENENFRNDFFNRHQDLFNTTFSTDVMVEAFDELADEMDSEMQNHLQTWPSLTYNDWRNVELESVKTYMRDRPNLAMDHMESYFDLDGRYDLELTSNAANSNFDLNSLKGMNYGFEGQYFYGIPITVIANPTSGNEFVYWEVTTSGETTIVENASLSMAFTADTKLNAVYQNATNVEVVNAWSIAQDGLNLQLELPNADDLRYALYDLDGKKLTAGSKTISNSSTSMQIPYNNATSGVKVLILEQSGVVYSTKILLVE